ncbi:SDR family oxidoreductase [Kineococcus rubinsiae]|uniref:SDR family oxidoreductase n=1 Tax=Kineococcus rubinsiae TaxID=2609562 RepID=UPI001430EB4F|nr:SDR family oxidoreductase [Kineococcus rubinsiae]NIZ89659.1 SDR family oxidoreductase [Kineococcus rubinsiae]
MSIVITATSGKLGRAIVQDLLARGVTPTDIVATARNLETITTGENNLAATGVRTAALDYDDTATVEAAVNAGDTLVLISGSDQVHRDRQHADVIAAATRVGVGHLIYTSGLQASTSASPIAASHAVTEDAVKASGLPFTITRNGWYTENYAMPLTGAKDSGVLLASVGDGRVASATRADMAAGVGAVITAGSDEHLGKTYEFSGDQAWDYNDLAAAFSEVLGREVTYQAVTPQQQSEILTGAGVPEQFVGMMVGADAGIRDGAFAFTNGDLSRLIGRPTTSLVEGLRPLT